MKKNKFAFVAATPLFLACSGHYDIGLGLKVSMDGSGGSTLAAGASSTAYETSTGGSTTSGGASTESGGESATGGIDGGATTSTSSMSSAGMSSVGGSGCFTGGACSTGGTSATGGVSSSTTSSSSGGSSSSSMTTGGATSTVGGMTSTGGASAVGGSMMTGGTGGGSSTSRSSVGGGTGSGPSTGGSSSMAGMTSTGGTGSVTGSGGTSSSATGGTTAVEGVPETGSSGCEFMSTATACPVTLQYIASLSLVTSVTFWGGCGVSKTGLLGWRPICTDVQCSSAGICICNTTVPSGVYLQVNADTGLGYAIGQRTGSDARAFCPTDYSSMTGRCNGTEGIVMDGGFFVNSHLCDVTDAVLNAQGNGDNYSILITC